MKLLDSINNYISRALQSRGSIIGASGEFDVNKYAFQTSWFWSPTLGVPRPNFNLYAIRDFARIPAIQMCIEVITEEIANLDWSIIPSEGFEEVANTVIQEQITDFFKYPNKDEEWNTFIRKLLKDTLELDAGVIVKTFGTNFYTKPLELALPHNRWSTKPFMELVSKATGRQPVYKYNGFINKTKFVKKINDESPRTKMLSNLSEPELKKALDTNNVGLLEIRVADGGRFVVSVDAYGRLWEDKPCFYQYNYITSDGSPQPFWNREIVYLKMNPQNDNWYGWSNIQTLMTIAEALNNATRFNAQIFSDYAIPSMIVQLEGELEPGLKKIRDQWHEKIKGKSQKVLFTGKKMDLKQLTMSATDMQWLEGMRFYMQIVMSTFHVTPNELGYTEDVNRSTGVVQDRVFLRKAILPLAKFIESKFNNEIIPEFYPEGFVPEVEFKFKIEDMLQEDRVRAHEIEDVNAGILTINEVREVRGLSKVEGGDQIKGMQQSIQGEFNDLKGSNNKDKEE